MYEKLINVQRQLTNITRDGGPLGNWDGLQLAPQLFTPQIIICRSHLEITCRATHTKIAVQIGIEVTSDLLVIHYRKTNDLIKSAQSQQS